MGGLGRHLKTTELFSRQIGTHLSRGPNLPGLNLSRIVVLLVVLVLLSLVCFLRYYWYLIRMSRCSQKRLYSPFGAIIAGSSSEELQFSYDLCTNVSAQTNKKLIWNPLLREFHVAFLNSEIMNTGGGSCCLADHFSNF